MKVKKSSVHLAILVNITTNLPAIVFFVNPVRSPGFLDIGSPDDPSGLISNGVNEWITPGQE
jgi:hypothetical protein